MTILCVSDIHWEAEGVDVLETLKQEIADIEPSLVLFGGDVIMDGSTDEEHSEEFRELLVYLEDHRVHSFTIQGNHDQVHQYDVVRQHIDTLSFAFEISGEAREYEGISVLGVPYEETSSLVTARELRMKYPGSYDIVLAHAQRRRRVWLFNLDTEWVITGHTDIILSQIDGCPFVSMDSYPSQRVLLSDGLDEVTYRRTGTDLRGKQTQTDTTVTWDGESLDWQELGEDPDEFPYRSLRYDDFTTNLTSLMAAKRRIRDSTPDEEKEIVTDLLEQGVPKTHIREYIGRYDFL